MLHTLALVTLALAAVGLVVASACDVPFLNALAPPKTTAAIWASYLIGSAVIAAYILYCLGIESPMRIAWPVALAYLAWCFRWNLRAGVVALLLCCQSDALGWNGLGHRVVADIAWSQLDAKARAEIVRTLQRNPRYDDDFARRAPTEGDQDRWIFQQAAVWPDMIRGNRKYDIPVWHYVNFPLFVGPERPVSFPLGIAPEGNYKNWNVIQAVAYCRKVLASDATPQAKAVAYCWLFHLVGDLHQPCHSTALVCDKLPEGDRGGNSIPLVQGRNLHSLWDNLLGRSDKPNDVKRAIVELEKHPEWWTVNTTLDVPAWVAESHELAESFVYCPEIMEAVELPGELTPIRLPTTYLVGAGGHARQRVVAAGLRLAALLGAKPFQPREPEDGIDFFDEAASQPIVRPSPRRAVAPAALTAAPALSHWLNTNTGERHNSDCRWFQNTKSGRMCTATEGDTCEQCGG